MSTHFPAQARGHLPPFGPLGFDPISMVLASMQLRFKSSSQPPLGWLQSCQQKTKIHFSGHGGAPVGAGCPPGASCSPVALGQLRPCCPGTRVCTKGLVETKGAC